MTRLVFQINIGFNGKTFGSVIVAWWHPILYYDKYHGSVDDAKISVFTNIEEGHLCSSHFYNSTLWFDCNMLLQWIACVRLLQWL